jgi:hypothetical protein
MEAMVLEHALPDDASARIWKEKLLEQAREELVVEDPRVAELEEEIDRNDEWAKGFIEKTDARIAELEAALKPFAFDYGDYSDGMWSDLDYIEVTVSDLRAARAAYRGDKE